MAAEAIAEVTGELDSAGVLLAAARESRRIAEREEGNVLQYAAHWAAMHSTDSLAEAACLPALPGMQEEIPIAGEGAPLVAEFCVAELTAALNLSTDAGRRLWGRRWSCGTGCAGPGAGWWPAICPPGGPGTSPSAPESWTRRRRSRSTAGSRRSRTRSARSSWTG